jgi:O-antigen ligase/Tfp pilus assembly protein PilF
MTCGVLLIAPFLFDRRLVDYANLPQTVFIQTISLVLVLAAIINITVHCRVTLTKNPVAYTVLLFLLWVLLSLIWARNRYESLIVVSHLISCGVVFFTVSSLVDEDEWVERILLTIVWAGVGVALLGCVQHLFKIAWIPQQIPPAATFGNKNMGSQVVSMVLPILPIVAFLPTRKKTALITKSISPLIALVCFTYLFFTVTRAAWLASGLSLSFVAIGLISEAARTDSLVRASRKIVFPVILSFVFLSVVLVFTTPKHFRDFLNVSKQNFVASFNQRASLDVRLIMWENGIEMFKDRPISGYGIGNFKIFYPVYHRKIAKDPVFSEGRQPVNIHNDFIQAGIELGVGGLLVFSGLFVVSLFVTFRLRGHAQPPKVRLIVTGLGGGILAMLVTALFSFPMERAVPSLILFTYLGVLAAYYNRQISGDRTRIFEVSRAVAILACVVVFAVTLIMTLFNYNRVASEIHYRRSLEMARISAWPEAINAGLKAYAANPQNMGALEAVGWGYVEIGEIDKGIESLSQVLEAYPYNIKAMRKLGEAYHKAGNVEKARETFETVIEIRPDSPVILSRLGSIHMKNKDYGDALRCFEEAAAYDNGNVLFHTNLGFLKFKMGRYSEAAQEYETVLKYRPDMLYAHISLASIYDRFIGQPDKALYHWQRCSQLQAGEAVSEESE